MTSLSRHDDDISARSFFADTTVALGGVLLCVTSLIEILHGAAAIADGDFYAQGSEYLYKFNMTTWGTVHVILGIIGVAVALGVLLRASWGPVAGMIVAGLTIMGNFAFLPHNPARSIVVIGCSVLVIWAFTVQIGRRPSTPEEVVPSHPADPHDVTQTSSP